MGTVNTPYFSTVTGTGFQQLNTAYAVPSPLWSSIDGAIINASELATGNLAPCLASTDTTAVNTLTVTIGGTAQTAVSTPTAITYAGFVVGSIAGLYQVNVQVPNVGNGSTAVQFPVLVTLGTGSPIPTSQASVTMWIK